MRVGLLLGVASALLALSSAARADPQWNASLLTGVCGRGARPSWWQDTCWYNGVRGDVLFGQSRDADLGVGPFAAVTTAGFDDLRLEGGASVLLPVSAFVPVGLSAGGYARKSEFGWEPGLSGWMFVGARSYNFDSSYSMAGGLLVGLQYGLGETRETTLVIGAQLDALALALPFLLGYQWLRGPPSDD